MRPSATGEAQATRGLIDRIVVLFVLALVLGPLINARIGIPGLLNPGTGTNTFFVQYREHEPLFLALLAVFLIAVAAVARRQAPDESSEPSTWLASHRTAVWLGAAACFVFAVAAAGTWSVMHATAFSMDEFVAQFQSRIFASGGMSTTIPDDWKQLGKALTPVYVAHDAERGVWTASYLPVYAALRAPFVGLGLDRLVNPALAALSVPLVYACARRLWPDRLQRAWLAVLFLVSSSQFLFMSMTGYAMPAHLVANLAWLYAYARADRAGWIAAPIIGVLALGLHNPFPHALFVAPFLLHLLLRRRWAWTAYFAIVYLAGVAFWYWWTQRVEMGGTGATAASIFAMPGLLMAAVQHLSLTLVFSWQTPVLALAVAWAIARWRTLSTMEKLLVPSVAVSFLFFFVFPSTQGHGWGYRYVYATLGNIVLLGAVGTDALMASLGRRFVQRLVVASLVLTAAVQLPVRAWQVERYVRPFARTHDYIANLDADVVIVDPTSSWYGIDLVRNDPFLHDRPKVLSAFYLRPDGKRLLAERFGSRVHMLTADEVGQFGIPTFPSRFRKGIWP